MNYVIGKRFSARILGSVLTTLVMLGCLSAASANTKAASSTRVLLDRQFSLRAGQQITVSGQRLRIRFARVEQDSRCPKNVTCVWAGNAAVRLEISTNRWDRKSLTLNTAGTSSLVSEGRYRGYLIKLLSLSPYPQTAEKIAPRKYIVTLLVSKTRAEAMRQPS